MSKKRKKSSLKSKKVKAGATTKEVFDKIVGLCPVIKNTDQFRYKSWEMFADKLKDAINASTVLFCVTVNPDILDNKTILEEAFPCKIVSPSEGLYAGGFDVMQRG